MYPNFLIIGAAKCGTTSLYHVLDQHPDVFLSVPKEPHFFSTLSDSSIDLKWYKKLFEAAGFAKAIGEASTSYTAPNRVTRAATRIANTIPDAKLIYMVRHPVKRLESDWKMRMHEGWGKSSINEAIHRQPELVTAGMYWKIISEYRNRFNDSNILVVFLEDFSIDPVREVKRCLQHIGVDYDIEVDKLCLKKKNDSAGFRKSKGLVKNVLNSEFWKANKQYIPSQIREAGKKLLTKKESYRVEWDPVLYESVLSELSEDTRLFLQFYGKHEDYWDMDGVNLLKNSDKG